jgi:CBS domain-containing protein
MNARDVMTVAVVSVSPDTSACEIARVLFDNGIGAVPVVVAMGRRSEWSARAI